MSSSVPIRVLMSDMEIYHEPDENGVRTRQLDP